ncbi:hypothetical protein BXU10_05490 [Flavobacterium sp. LM4]|nr:hypothetical protein BXU10_05490 [Flavobacterium sp. LM4]
MVSVFNHKCALKTLIDMNKQKIAVIASILIVLTGFIDTKLDLLQGVGFSLITINRIKLAGLVLSAVLPSVTPLFSKEEK